MSIANIKKLYVVRLENGMAGFLSADSATDALRKCSRTSDKSEVFLLDEDIFFIFHVGPDGKLEAFAPQVTELAFPTVAYTMFNGYHPLTPQAAQFEQTRSSEGGTYIEYSDSAAWADRIVEFADTLFSVEERRLADQWEPVTSHVRGSDAQK